MRLTSSLSIAAPFLILLGSCVGPAQERARAPAPPAPVERLPPRPSSTPPAASAAPPSVEWQYRPAHPGNWVYRADAAGSAALFGATAADPLLTIRCDRGTRRVSLIRAGVSTGTAMTVRTSYGAASLPATAAAPQTTAVRAASDGLLDQIAYSRGKFAIEAAGLPPLIVPAWAEIARVMEDCRG